MTDYQDLFEKTEGQTKKTLLIISKSIFFASKLLSYDFPIEVKLVQIYSLFFIIEQGYSESITKMSQKYQKMLLRSFRASKKNKTKELLQFSELYVKAYEHLNFTAFTNVR